MSTASQITSSSHNLSLEAVMGEKIYRYMRGFQSIADRLRNQNMSKEDIQRLYNTVHSDWGPGCTYQYPKRHDKDAIKAFLDMCDKWYEEMDRTTDNLKLMHMQFGFAGGVQIIPGQVINRAVGYGYMDRANRLLVNEAKRNGTFMGFGMTSRRRDTQLYDLVQTEFKSKDRNGRVRKIFVVDFVSSVVNGNTYVVKYDGEGKEERIDEDEMLSLYEARE